MTASIYCVLIMFSVCSKSFTHSIHLHSHATSRRCLVSISQMRYGKVEERLKSHSWQMAELRPLPGSVASAAVGSQSASARL